MNNETKSLSPEQSELCPFGSPKCRICRMSPDRIKKTHDLRFKQKWSLRKIADFLSEKKWCGKDYKTLSEHFKKHVSLDYRKQINKGVEVAKVLNNKMIHTRDDVKKAYDLLLEMILNFSGRIDKICAIASERINDENALRKEINKKEILELMTVLSRLQKESISQISAISNLRTPKVVVAEQFKKFVDDSIVHFNNLLFDIFGMLKDSVMDALNNGGVNEDTFTSVFKKAAMEYKNRMSMIRQEQVHELTKVLSELERLA